MSGEILATLVLGGLAQTLCLGLYLAWRDRRSTREAEPTERLSGWIARVERESKARDEALSVRLTKAEEELPGRVATLVVNEVMAAIKRQKTRQGVSLVEQALVEARAARKAVDESEDKA